MTTTSLNFREAAFASETDRVPIALITIEHDDLTGPMRISTDPTQEFPEHSTDENKVYGTLSNGIQYLFFPVRLTLPDDTEDGPGEMKLEIDNVLRQYTADIRSIFTPAICQVDIVMDNALDVVDASWPEFKMTNIEYNATIITATLRLETLDTEPYPAGKFMPSSFPGLF
jgi:hypothetical protein